MSKFITTDTYIGNDYNEKSTDETMKHSRHIIHTLNKLTKTEEEKEFNTSMITDFKELFDEMVEDKLHTQLRYYKRALICLSLSDKGEKAETIRMQLLKMVSEFDEKIEKLFEQFDEEFKYKFEKHL